MGKAAVPVVKLGAWGRAKFLARLRTLCVAVVHTAKGKKQEVAMRGNFKIERWSVQKGKHEEVEYSVLDQNGGRRAGLRVSCSFLDDCAQIKLHHLVAYLAQFRSSKRSPSASSFASWRAGLKRGRRVVDHLGERWWDFGVDSLVEKSAKKNTEKAAAVTKAGTRPAPRKARR